MWASRDYSAYMSESWSINEGSQGKNSWRQELEDKPGRSATYGLLFHCFSVFVCLFVFFIKTQGHLCKGGTTHSELGPPALITNQENTLQTCPRGNLLCSDQVTLFVSHNPVVWQVLPSMSFVLC